MPANESPDEDPARGDQAMREWEAFRIVAEVADELSRSVDVCPAMRDELWRAAGRIAFALEHWPVPPREWHRIAPVVVNELGVRTTIPEMLLIEGIVDPRRTARVLLRALDWDLLE